MVARRAVYFKSAFEKHADALAAAGANPNNGLGAVLEAIKSLPNAAAAIVADIEACYDRADRPKIAMVDSDKGITNLHVPSDVIIDASMPAMIRDSGKMWNARRRARGRQVPHPRPLVRGHVPGVHRGLQEANGQFDVATMGNVANVGLMAQKAEEYGSHDKTFERPRWTAGAPNAKVDEARKERRHLRARRRAGRHLAHVPDQGRRRARLGALAVTRARAPARRRSFGSTRARAHDAALIAKVNGYLAEHDTSRTRHLDQDAGRRDRAGDARARAPARTPSPSRATSCATTSPTSSRSSSSARRRRCCRSSPCSPAAASSRRAPAAPRRSTCSSSPRRATCAGTRSASTSRSRCRSTTSRSRRATRRSRSSPRA